ncbi:MAG TPA: cytochrome c [Rhizomicrobium sp.]|jgi:mono/diheme cytochrome c family protein
MTGKCLLAGAIVVAVVVVLAALAAFTGVYDVAADAPHTTLMKSVIAFVRERSIDVRANAIHVPPLDPPQMISEGAGHYDEMCTGCHLAPGMKENEMRPGMNPKPPVLARVHAGSPAEQFWIVKHGIKMSGMPAWGPTHTDTEIWDIVAFLQKLPSLAPSQYRALVAQASGHHQHESSGMDMPHRH